MRGLLETFRPAIQVAPCPRSRTAPMPCMQASERLMLVSSPARYWLESMLVVAVLTSDSPLVCLYTLV